MFLGDAYFLLEFCFQCHYIVQSLLVGIFIKLCMSNRFPQLNEVICPTCRFFNKSLHMADMQGHYLGIKMETM